MWYGLLLVHRTTASFVSTCPVIIWLSWTRVQVLISNAGHRSKRSGIGRSGCGQNENEQNGIGQSGSERNGNWLLDELVIGQSGYWTKWALDELELDNLEMNEVEMDELATGQSGCEQSGGRAITPNSNTESTDFWPICYQANASQLHPASGSTKFYNMFL